MRNKWFENTTVTGALGGAAGFYFSHEHYVYHRTTPFPIEFSLRSNDENMLDMLDVRLGCCINPGTAVHFVAGSQIYNAVVTNDKDINPNSNISIQWLFIAPENYLEVNLVSDARLYAGPSHYFTIGNDSCGRINDENINGFAFNFLPSGWAILMAQSASNAGVSKYV